LKITHEHQNLAPERLAAAHPILQTAINAICRVYVHHAAFIIKHSAAANNI
jgi:hypothetical protein